MNTKPIVVIGAGFGGLAAAIRLRAKGYAVTLVEANEQAGGRASVFERNGYVFDAGPTVITAPYLIEELFASVGRDMNDYLELMPVDPFYRVLFHDGASFDYVGDEDRIVSQIREMSPGDVDGYAKLAAHAERIFDIGYTQLADQPFDRLSDMLRVVPDMIKLESYRTVAGLVGKYIKDERLRQVFSFQPLLVGGNPYNVTSIYMLIHWLERKWGVHFPKGGTGALVKSLVTLFEEVGGELRLNSPVEEIEVKDGRAVAVKIEGGDRIECSGVVSNADPTMVYKHLVGKEHRKKHTDASLNRKRQSMSLFVSYFGTDKKFDDVAHHTIVLGPRYKGLLDDIFHKRVLADDFSLYLHRPTASDPDLAPEGGETFYVLSPVPNDKSGIDWSQRGDEYEDRILSHLDKTHMPGLKASLKEHFYVDPRYFSERLRSADGAAFGIEPVLRQSAYMRFHNRSEDVKDLWFVGASSHPGAGVPGVLCSAKVLDKQMPDAPANERVPLPPKSGRKAA
jgi:phytoene desaturase